MEYFSLFIDGIDFTVSIFRKVQTGTANQTMENKD